MRQELLLGAVFALGVGIVAGVFLLSSDGSPRDTGPEAYSVPGMPGMTASVAHDLSDELTPALLLVIYDAFAQTQEDAIYDRLAEVTYGDALEQLYLERVGAMAGGGLDEADQEIHEISMVNSRAQRDGEKLVIDATWQVIGTVGHAEHLHVRGNTYSADLAIAPRDGAWKITHFDLREVSRNGAGETFLAAEGDQ